MNILHLSLDRINETRRSAAIQLVSIGVAVFLVVIIVMNVLLIRLQKQSEQLEARKREVEIADKVKSLSRFPTENPHPVLRTNVEGDILYANKGADYFLETYGIKEGDIIPPSYSEILKRAVAGEKAINFDERVRGRFYSWSMCYIPSGKYVNLYGIDITEKVQAENKLREAYVDLQKTQDASLNILEDLDKKQKELRKARDELEERVKLRTKELEQMHEDKNRFISRASHDLRTPIAAIAGFSQLLLKQKWGKLTSEQQERLEKIDGHSDRLTKIVSDLLSISRIEAGVIGIALEAIPIHQEIEKVITEMKDNLQAKSQSIKFQNGKEDEKVMGDQTSIHQVLTNLLDNASKYSPENTSITVTTEKNSSEFIIHVADEGIGLEAKNLTQVFEEFYRAEEGGETQTQGTGLGLAIVKKLVTQMDGKVWVDSDGPGQGSTFSFSLPRAGKGE